MINQRKPVHPGEVLREDIIIPLGLTVTEAAKRLKVNRKTLSSLLSGRTQRTTLSATSQSASHQRSQTVSFDHSP